MKQIRTAQELYCEIVKSFYFGIYPKGGRLLTYQEMHEIYGLAKDTIGAAYGMLQSDGFILTDRRNGTTVTFDINNPVHVAKVPIEWPRPGAEDTTPYEVSMWLHASTLCRGLECLNEVQLQECRKMTEKILQYVRNGDSYYDQVMTLWRFIIAAADNEFLYRITDHFLSRYLYLIPPARLTYAQRVFLCTSALDFYEFLQNALKRREFGEFRTRFERHYNNYYQEGGVVFSKSDEETFFKEQVLYSKLLQELSVKIITGNLRKGAALPTTARLCAEYGISKTTVSRAYGILTEMGIISRHAGTGTRLIAEPGDPVIQDKLEAAAGLHEREWRDAAEVLIFLHNTLSQRLTIAPETVHQMRIELMRQWNLLDQYSVPLYVYNVLLSPVIASLPTGILHKYYFFITDSLQKVMTLCTFRITGNQEHGIYIYQLVCDALDALECNNQALFAVQAEHAMRENVRLLMQDYNSASGRPVININ